MLKLVFMTSLVLMVLAAIACSTKATPSTSLIEAIANEDIGTVQDHIEAGTDPNDQFIELGNEWAGAYAMHIAVLVQNPEIITTLVEAGASPQIAAKDAAGGTPLQWAAYWAVDPSIAELLINLGADVNAKDKNGWSVLCAALIENIFVTDEDVEEFKKKREKIAAILIAKGASL